MSGFPLTDAQTAIWLHHVFLPDKPICNTGQVVCINGPVDTDLFRRAITATLEEADALRIRVGIEAGRSYQEACTVGTSPVDFADFSIESDPLSEAQAWIDREFWTTIPWTQFPLFRFVLLKLSNERFLWLQKHHHLIVDATGGQLLTKRVADAYEALLAGREPPPSNAARFCAIVDAERDYGNSVRFKDDGAYWLERFADLPTPVIEGDRLNSERSRSGRPARIDFHIEKTVWDSLERLAKANRSTAFKAVIVLIYLAFSRLYGVEDLGFGIPLANRTGKFKQTIGLFSHVMPFRLRLQGDTPFRNALAHAGELLTRDYAHSRYPISLLTRKLQARHGRIPLYDVTVNYVPTEYDFGFAGAALSATNLSRGFFSPWAVAITDFGDRGLNVAVTYDQGLIRDAEATRFRDSFESLLRNGVADGDRPIASM